MAVTREQQASDPRSGPAYVVRNSDGRVVLICSGADAADAAIDWVERGYEVEEIEASPFGLPQVATTELPISA